MPKVSELKEKLELWSTTSVAMKPLRHAIDRPTSRHIMANKALCLSNSKRSKAENWFAEKLQRLQLPWKFSRQAVWGYRIYDFWMPTLGVAIEIDGPEHKQAYDSYRDEYNFRRSAIIVIHIPNFDEAAAQLALDFVNSLSESWKQRRERLNVKGRALLGGRRIHRSQNQKAIEPPHLADRSL